MRLPSAAARAELHQPLRDELRRLWSVKELPPRPWLVFTCRWAGRLWFSALAKPLPAQEGRMLQRARVRAHRLGHPLMNRVPSLPANNSRRALQADATLAKPGRL